MSKKKDPNFIVKLENAIKEKYGEEAIQNPKKNWDDEKERQYVEDLKILYKRKQSNNSEDKIDMNGVLMDKKLFNKDSSRSCPVCNTYSFSFRDDVYMTKFECCEKCYIQWVEDREERWKTGWRPNK
jgi:hypothetical protein